MVLEGKGRSTEVQEVLCVTSSKLALLGCSCENVSCSQWNTQFPVSQGHCLRLFPREARPAQIHQAALRRDPCSILVKMPWISPNSLTVSPEIH